MDFMKTEYEFLDLSDVKEADRSSLQCALFKQAEIPEPPFKIAATEALVDLSTSTSVAGAPVSTVSRSVEAAGDGDMAPHSPARAPPAPPHPPPYAQPPPAYPPPHHQWPVAPPNVYVSQVTANVNVHGYMGQYYQPQPQYAPPAPAVPQDRTGRPHRRDRRGKRPPSPPQHPPYYLQYPQYYPAAQAQGAPLYHLPMYQPVVYGHYPYPPYYQEYPIPVEGEPDKGPEEYPPEVVMEQEAVDAYYTNAHYAPPYGPPVDAGVEYMSPVYLPPPPHVPAAQVQAHHHQHMAQPQPHQFNVHAKNFVLGQGKSYAPQDKQEPRTPPEAPSVSAVNVESLPMKDLKIAHKGPSSPKHNERAIDVVQAKVPSPTEKAKPIESTKTAWVPENKVDPNFVHQQLAAKPFVPPVTTAQIAANKLPPATSKPTKGPAAPFSGNKQPPKPSVPQTIVPQQAATTPKAPFGNRQKREGPANRSPSSEHAESGERNADHMKREPSLPPSKAPMPISITLPAAGQPLIVANKPPFGHSRKAQVPDPPPVPQPPPPAPTASDFPPPPTPRNRGELPPPVAAPQPQPAPGKSWASLFSSKTSSVAPPLPTPVVHQVEEPPSPTTVTPAVANIQKPVAKVQPYDASPLQQATIDKGSPTPRPQPLVPPVAVAPAISYSEKAISYSEKAISYSEKALSYSEKTSANVSPAASSPVAHAKPPLVQPEPREVPIQKETVPAAPVQPSPYCDDPNSYRMGEFLSKYQLDNRAVSVLPRGLTNRSNYCYVNAILQALIACPPFYNMLKALPYQTRRGKSSTPVIDSMVELCYEFSPLPTPPRNARGAGVPAPQVPAGPPLEGGAGLRVLRALRPFPGSQEGRQEDAEEFLGCLLNSLNDEMLELMKLVEPEEPKDAATGQTNGVITQEIIHDDEDDDDEWKVMGPKNRGAVERRWAARRTPVSDIFRGKTRVRLHRATHHDVTDAVQPFFTLQLDIERASNVKDALELLAGKDTLEGVNDAWQQLSLEQLPVVLLLHLKCFQLDADGHTAKIVKPIDFPMDLKIDPKIMSSKQKYTSKQRLYKLFAVVYHEGVEAVKGHYVTDTYHGQSGWIRYDDATVTQVNDGMVLKAKPPRMPYLLMYRRQDTLPPHRAKPE